MRTSSDQADQGSRQDGDGDAAAEPAADAQAVAAAAQPQGALRRVRRRPRGRAVRVGVSHQRRELRRGRLCGALLVAAPAAAVSDEVAGARQGCLSLSTRGQGQRPIAPRQPSQRRPAPLAQPRQPKPAGAAHAVPSTSIVISIIVINSSSSSSSSSSDRQELTRVATRSTVRPRRGAEAPQQEQQPGPGLRPGPGTGPGTRPRQQRRR